MTVLRFGGGEVTVTLSFDEVRDLLRNALANGALVELEAQDGQRILINAQQVEVVKDADEAAPSFSGAVESDTVTA